LLELRTGVSSMPRLREDGALLGAALRSSRRVRRDSVTVAQERELARVGPAAVAEHWQAGALGNQSVAWVQTALLLAVWALEVSSRALALSQTGRPGLLIAALALSSSVAHLVYGALSAAEAPLLVERPYGRAQFWLCRNAAHSALLLALCGSWAAGAVLAAAGALEAALICALVLPWPVEAYELNARKALALQAARTRGTAQFSLAEKLVAQLLVAVVVGYAGDGLRGPVFSLLYCSTSLTAASALHNFDLAPLRQVLPELESRGSDLFFPALVLLLSGMFHLSLQRALRQLPQAATWLEASSRLVMLLYSLMLGVALTVPALVFIGLLLLPSLRAFAERVERAQRAQRHRPSLSAGGGRQALAASTDDR
jgi:hypothetical protein